MGDEGATTPPPSLDGCENKQSNGSENLSPWHGTHHGFSPNGILTVSQRPHG